VYTVDETVIRGSVEACFNAGADVERWPDRLPHYRWVRFQRKDGFGTGRVEMADMHLDESRPAVIYHHVDGITTGMYVEWTFEDIGNGQTRVRIVHDWKEGPRWPLPGFVRRAIGSAVIGPVFIHHVASRTLAGIKRHVENG
jgi:hypothetical protein